MNLWLKDPKDGTVSVSLTLLVIFAVGALVSASLNMAGVVQNTSTFTELFYSACALYFGRRFSFKGQSFSSEKAEEIEKKVEGEK